MGKDLKLLVILAIGTIALAVAGVLVFSKEKSTTSQVLSKLDATTLSATPEFYDLGNIPYGGGIVERTYEVKNTTNKSVKLKKIATSCMCTKVKVSLNGKDTRFFGMEAHGDLNPPVNLEIKAGETARVIADFDPAAHGPAGIGPVDRSIYLTFSEPSGVKELKFSGVVVEK